MEYFFEIIENNQICVTYRLYHILIIFQCFFMGHLFGDQNDWQSWTRWLKH